MKLESLLDKLYPSHRDARAGAGRPLDYGYGQAYCFEDVKGTLRPLLDRLQAYDALRVQLEKRGGEVSDLAAMTDLLSGTVTIRGRYEVHEVSLAEQASIKSMLRDVTNAHLHFDVRRLPNGLPVYCLCRIHFDYLGAYGLVVEDLYQRP